LMMNCMMNGDANPANHHPIRVLGIYSVLH
jgi:hypothetical protein